MSEYLDEFEVTAEMLEDSEMQCIADADFTDKATIAIDKVVPIEEATLMNGESVPIELDDLTDDELDAIDEADEDFQNPIKSLVKGRVISGNIEIGFAAIVDEGDEVKVFTENDDPNGYEVREIAAMFVEERLMDYLDD